MTGSSRSCSTLSFDTLITLDIRKWICRTTGNFRMRRFCIFLIASFFVSFSIFIPRTSFLLSDALQNISLQLIPALLHICSVSDHRHPNSMRHTIYLLFFPSVFPVSLDIYTIFQYYLLQETGFHRVGLRSDRTCLFLFLFPKYHKDISFRWKHIL